MKLKNLIIFVLLCGVTCSAQIINCPAGFNAGPSGACSVTPIYPTPSSDFVTHNAANFVGSSYALAPTGSTHNSYNMTYKTAVDIRAFTAAFTFVPNTWNFAFVVQNSTTNPGYTGPAFSAGAGCEGGFYQATNQAPYPNNVFALSFSNSDYLHAADGSYGGSNVQLFQQGQIPCNEVNDSFPIYWSTTRLSTNPVQMSSPSTTQYTTTGDTYSATVSYDGSNFSLCFYDVTAATGSCSSSTSGTGTFYTHTWANVPIPSYMDSTTAYVGLSSGVGSGPAEPSTSNMLVNTFTYTVQTATAGPPTTTAPVNGAPATANPTFSPSAGTYSGTQNVTISSSTGSSYSCYVLSASTCAGAVTPIPANDGTCGGGTLYSSPVAVASTQTLCARSGTNYGGTMPSGLASAAYIITGGVSAQPTLISGKAVISGKTVILH